MIILAVCIYKKINVFYLDDFMLFFVNDVIHITSVSASNICYLYIP